MAAIARWLSPFSRQAKPRVVTAGVPIARANRDRPLERATKNTACSTQRVWEHDSPCRGWSALRSVWPCSVRKPTTAPQSVAIQEDHQVPVAQIEADTE